MGRYLTRRLAGFAFSLALVTVLVFLAFQVLPGDAAQVALGIDANPANLAAMRHDLGLDVARPVQYLRWVGALAHGDLGHSLRFGLPVLGLIGRALPVTVGLAALSSLVALGLALPLGVQAAARRGGALDWVVGLLSEAGLAIPSFWLGLLLMLLFAVRLQWLPPGGYSPLAAGPGAWLASLVLPSFALGLARGAALLRLVRQAVAAALGQEFVRTARAKGVPERRVLYLHALRPALLPTVTLFGLQVGQLLAGSVVVERVFALPGLGRLLLDAIGQRDLPVVQGAVLVAAGGIVMINLCLDLAYARLDPRITY